MRNFAAILFLLIMQAPAMGQVTLDIKADKLKPPPAYAGSQTVRASAVADEKIKIDGSLDDWPNDKLPLRALGSKDRQDLDAAGYLAVSPTSLYLAFDVTDDTHYQPDYGDRMWKFDSVQFAIDPLTERTAGRYGDYVHEIGLCFVDGAPLVWRWHHPEGLKSEKLADAQLAVRFESGKAVYEARIPLQELWPLRPELGNPMGFAYVVNDSDGGHDRESMVTWASGIGSGKDASLFGTVAFPEVGQEAVAVAARYLLPSDPTPAAEPQEWVLDLYAAHAGRLDVLCSGRIEHGRYKGSSVNGKIVLNVPQGVSKWRLSVDPAKYAPARISVRLATKLDGVSDKVASPVRTIYVYTPIK